MVGFSVVPIDGWGLFPSGGPALIAGPCSAESGAQIMETARFLSASGVRVLRAGLWKPRTHPGTFEGAGPAAFPWLLNAKHECGMKLCTEVACASHVRECLRNGIDAVWIGARTTANPFLVQEIADALDGTDIPVMVKNPPSPDLDIWTGAVERFFDAGLRKIALVHRGFTPSDRSMYRNEPRWRLILEMKNRHPELPIICDPSHIAGERALVGPIAQRALDLGYDALMVEAHCCPEKALSDAPQQLGPDGFCHFMGSLSSRSKDSAEEAYRARLEELRSRIDVIDDELVRLLAERMEACRRIGVEKKTYNVSIVQSSRWENVLAKASSSAEALGLDTSFVKDVFNLIHEASVNEQNSIISEYDEN